MTACGAHMTAYGAHITACGAHMIAYGAHMTAYSAHMTACGAHMIGCTDEVVGPLLVTVADITQTDQYEQCLCNRVYMKFCAFITEKKIMYYFHLLFD